MNTEELISKLSQDELKKASLNSPLYYGLWLISILLLYATISLLFLEIRPDMGIQLGRFPFILEIVLLLFLTFAGSMAAIFSMYPDCYQKPFFLKVPCIIFVALISFIAFQIITMPFDPRMVVIPSHGHGMECALCIAALACLPSALIFGLVRKGATVTSVSAGSLSVLAASGLGSLILRLTETDDSLLHIALWHYVPTLLFAAIGAVLGRFLLKW